MQFLGLIAQVSDAWHKSDIIVYKDTVIDALRAELDYQKQEKEFYRKQFYKYAGLDREGKIGTSNPVPTMRTMSSLRERLEDNARRKADESRRGKASSVKG